VVEWSREDKQAASVMGSLFILAVAMVALILGFYLGVRAAKENADAKWEARLDSIQTPVECDHTQQQILAMYTKAFEKWVLKEALKTDSMLRAKGQSQEFFK